MTSEDVQTAGPLTEPESTLNARVTVAYGHEAVSFDLEGTDLSETTQPDGTVQRYFTYASATYVAHQVERAVKHLAHGASLPGDLTPVTDTTARDVATGADPIREALDLLLYAPVLGGGTEHDLESDHDGDGWNDPFSDRYACICGEFAVEWVQTDPEQHDRPSPVDVALAWRAHYEAFCAAAAD